MWIRVPPRRTPAREDDILRDGRGEITEAGIRADREVGVDESLRERHSDWSGTHGGAELDDLLRCETRPESPKTDSEATRSPRLSRDLPGETDGRAIVPSSLERRLDFRDLDDRSADRMNELSHRSGRGLNAD